MSEADRKPEHLVILVHGIRDISRWQSEIKKTLRDGGFAVESTNYDRMNLLEFLFPAQYFRNKAKLTVWTQIQHAKLMHPDAKEISVIAHSFGTYILAQILKEQFSLKFHRVILCGSVLRFNFPIEQFTTRYTSPILNEVGTADPWPATAEAVTSGYGSVGTYGFNRPGVEDRFHNGAGHGYFLNRTFCETFWLPFLLNGSVETGDVPGKSPHLAIQLISIFKIKYAIAAVAILFIAFYCLRFLFLPIPISYDFGARAKFVYWGPGLSRMAGSATAPCPLPWPLCSYKSIVGAITERRYVSVGAIQNDVLDNIVSCRNFTFPAPSRWPSRDPVSAIEELAGDFPACISTSIDGASDRMTITPNTARMTLIPRSGGRPGVYLCDCSAAETQAYRDTQSN